MNVLAVDGGSRQGGWIRRQLHELLEDLGRAAGPVEVGVRDLALIPQLAAPNIWELGEREGRAPEYLDSRHRSDQLVAEVEAADLLVLATPVGLLEPSPALPEWFRQTCRSRAYGAPVHAPGLTPTLHNWFNHVIRADRTFRYTAEGPRGLLRDKSAIILAAHVAPWPAGAAVARQIDSIELMLRYMGIDMVSVIETDQRGWSPAQAAPAPVAEPARLSA